MVIKIPNRKEDQGVWLAHQSVPFQIAGSWNHEVYICSNRSMPNSLAYTDGKKKAVEKNVRSTINKTVFHCFILFL